MNISTCSIGQSLIITAAIVAIAAIIVAYTMRASDRERIEVEDRRAEELSNWYAQSGKAMRATSV